MIEHGLYGHPGPPMVVARSRAVLPCGCFAAVATRELNKSPTINAALVPVADTDRLNNLASLRRGTEGASRPRTVVSYASSVIA